MRVVQRHHACAWLAPAIHAALVEAELARLGVRYFRSEGTYVWQGGSAAAVRYEFRVGPQLTPVQEAFDRLVAAGLQVVGDHVMKSPFDGGVSLF